MATKGGYQLIDCTGLDLTKSTATSLPGIWDKAELAIAAQKPIVACGTVYGSGNNVSPVVCFGWYLASDEIVIVGATLHIHIKDDDTYQVLDVAS